MLSFGNKEDRGSIRVVRELKFVVRYFMISIIIPNFNKANFVKETLCSLMAQTYANFEVDC